MSVVADEIYIGAARYALNRYSYMSQSVCRALFVSARDGCIGDKAMRTLIRDIQSAIENKVIPYEDQINDWRNLQNALEFYLNPREQMR